MTMQRKLVTDDMVSVSAEELEVISQPRLIPSS